MTKIDYAWLQEQYGGQYVATRNGRVVASAPTYDDLSRQLDTTAVPWNGLLIEYVDPTDVIVYLFEHWR